MDVHQYWHGGDLPPLAQLSATTLLAHHSTVTLWSYDPLANLPPGVRTRDARDAWPSGGPFWTGVATTRPTSATRLMITWCASQSSAT